MATASASQWWRRLRLVVRGCRICLLLLVLVLLCGYVYLNVAGLPEMLSRALRTELEARGVALDFDSLRLDWNWAISAQGVKARSAREAGTPEVRFGELLIRLNWSRALRGHVDITALTFREGQVTVNLAPTNQPPDLVSVNELSGDLRFLAGDQWELDSFRGQFLGAKLTAFGTVTNALALRHALTTHQPAVTDTNVTPVSPWSEPLRPALIAWRQLKFISPPEARLRFSGDARIPRAFTGDFHLTTTGIISPWGNARGFDFDAFLNQVPEDGAIVVKTTVRTDEARTVWLDLTGAVAEARFGLSTNPTSPRWLEVDLRSDILRQGNLRLEDASMHLRSTPAEDRDGGWRTTLRVQTARCGHQDFSVQATALEAEFVHDLRRWIPDAGKGTLSLSHLEGRPGQVETLKLAAEFARSATSADDSSPNVPEWLRPWRVTWNAEAGVVRSGPAQINALRTHGRWGDTRLALTNTVAELSGTTLTLARMECDLRNRELCLSAVIRGQPLETAAPWLSEPVRNQLATVNLTDPMTLGVEARATLPPQLNRDALASLEFRRSVTATANLQLGRVAWRGIEAESGQAQIQHTGDQLALTAFSLRRPEGALTLTGRLDLATHAFVGWLESGVLPQASQPILGAKGAAAFRVFEFRQAPQLTANFQGQGADLARLGAAASVTCGDFAVRGQDLQRLSAQVQLTNLFVSARNLEVFHGDQFARADGLGFDARIERLFLTNATSNMEPMVAARAIGTNVVRAIEQYHFLERPNAVVNGSLITKGKTNHADMRFDVDGGAFEYWRFRVPNLKGTVFWQEETVTVTNLTASFYEGQVRLNLHADLIPGGQAAIGFDAVFTDADLRKGLADLVPGTNDLDGVISGRLTVDRLLTDDWKSWQGNGEATLRKGYLWDLPLFAVLSEVVNVIVPGAGKARASAGTCSFVMTNSVLHSKDVQIEARPLRLTCRGNVDFDANVNMDVEAQVLPGIPLIGPLFNLAISPVSKALTYRVSGTLGNPRVQPLYVPRFLSSILNLGRTPKGAKPAEAGQPPKH